MCRNIKQLRTTANQPPAGPEEIRAAALQYVRKVSGYRTPSQANQAAFDQAVEQIAEATRLLLDSLQTKPPPTPTPAWEEDDLGFFYRGAW
jgi:hypothetical protein